MRIMNLVNLPMLKSAAIRKLTGEKAVPHVKLTHESLKKQIKMEFAKSMGLTSMGADPEPEPSCLDFDGSSEAAAPAKRQKLQKTEQKKGQFMAQLLPPSHHTHYLWHMLFVVILLRNKMHYYIFLM